MVSKNINSADNWDSHWSDFSTGVNINPAEQLRFNLVFNILKKHETSSKFIIDFGCGTGLFLKELNDTFNDINIIGFEYSNTGIEISKKNLPQGKFYQKNMLENDATPEEVLNLGDYGVCTEVLEHVDEPVLFLKNVRKYLKKGARLIITVPGGKMSAFDKYLGHRKHFSSTDMENILLEVGFVNFRVRNAGFPFFNLYKCMIILRGQKLVDDCKDVTDGKLGILSKLLSKLFGILFKLNINNTPFGWQIIAEIEN